MGRLCEEFGCLPTEAMREARRLPANTLEDIIEYRAYARVKAMYDAADTPEAKQKLPRSALLDLVESIEFEIAREEMS